MSGYITRIHALQLRNAVALLKEVSERYAPNKGITPLTVQYSKVEEELHELNHELWGVSEGEDQSAKECADLVIAAVRLGTMLSPDFAKVILDKVAELNDREPLP